MDLAAALVLILLLVIVAIGAHLWLLIAIVGRLDALLAQDAEAPPQEEP